MTARGSRGHSAQLSSRSSAVSMTADDLDDNCETTGLFQYTEAEEVKICLASMLSSIQAICLNGVRRHAWIISVSRGFFGLGSNSSLDMK